MTIPLFGDYPKLAPEWTKRLPHPTENRMIETRFTTEDGKRYNIGEPNSCLSGEIYLRSEIYEQGCHICNNFGYTFFSLIEEIPSKINVSWWNESKSKWGKDLIKVLERSSMSMPQERRKSIIEMYKYYEKVIDNYGDLFNAFANNYIQHLAQCDFYAENVALVR